MRRLVLMLSAAACSTTPGGVSDGNPGAADADPSAPDATPGARDCTDRSAQPLDATWQVAGRDVQVHVPASYQPTRATPVVVNLHGLTSSGEQLIEHSQLLPVSDANGFVAIHPDGTGTPRSWNAGVCCDPAASAGTDDLAFLDAVLDEAEARLCVDPDRVYVAGFSNGAFLAYRAACELADRIAAIAPISGQLGVATCAPSRPVPAFHVHGTDDLIVPHDGGGLSGYPSVDDTMSRWRAINGCESTTTETYQNGDATCVAYTGCEAAIERCTIDGGGHQWPGGESNGPFGGTLSDDLDASAALWVFFAAHPRT